MGDIIEKVIDMCTIEDLIRGYIYDDAHRAYVCLYCGDVYEEDIIYNHGEKLCSARRAIEVHISDNHGSPFDFLIGLDKKYTGLTDRQVEIFHILYNENDTRVVAELMETTPATVRSYRFKMREKLRQSKIYSALFYLIERQSAEDKNQKSSANRETSIYDKLKSIKDNINDEKVKEAKELAVEEFKDLDLNTMNLFIGKRRPDVK